MPKKSKLCFQEPREIVRHSNRKLLLTKRLPKFKSARRLFWYRSHFFNNYFLKRTIIFVPFRKLIFIISALNFSPTAPTIWKTRIARRPFGVTPSNKCANSIFVRTTSRKSPLDLYRTFDPAKFVGFVFYALIGSCDAIYHLYIYIYLPKNLVRSS